MTNDNNELNAEKLRNARVGLKLYTVIALLITYAAASFTEMKLSPEQWTNTVRFVSVVIVLLIFLANWILRLAIANNEKELTNTDKEPTESKPIKKSGFQQRLEEMAKERGLNSGMKK